MSKPPSSSVKSGGKRQIDDLFLEIKNRQESQQDKDKYNNSNNNNNSSSSGTGTTEEYDYDGRSTNLYVGNVNPSMTGINLHMFINTCTFIYIHINIYFICD